jgi:sterol desaturase/sphingolipid hydroxylase (fatty acid hydroxylase superfamily)
MDWPTIRHWLLPWTDSDDVWVSVVFWLGLFSIGGLELLVPVHRNSRREQRWPANFGLGLINLTLLSLLPASSVLAAVWAKSHGVGLLNWLRVPWIEATFVTIAIRSFSSYAIHVVLHHVDFLWRIHRVHHFDMEVDVSTGLRTHPFEYALAFFLGLMLAVAFGLSPWAVLCYDLAESLFAFLSHANIRVPARLDRLLRLLIVTPALHALHHSSWRPETDSNFGTVLTLWDRIFRTYRDPQVDRGGDRQFGLSDVRDERTADLWWQLKSPLVKFAPAQSAAPEHEITDTLRTPVAVE